MGIAVAAEAQHRFAVPSLDEALEPHLARATHDLVPIVTRLVGQRRHHAAELDQIAVALLPVLEELEIREDLVKRCRHGFRVRQYSYDIRALTAPREGSPCVVWGNVGAADRLDFTAIGPASTWSAGWRGCAGRSAARC